MIHRTSGIAVLASLTVVLTMEASTSALCQLDDPYDLWWEPDQDTIYVKVNANMEEICIPHGGTSDCADLDDVVRTIRVALDEFNDNAAANIRFAYWGITYAAVGAKLPGYVHIFRDPNYGAAAAHTVLNDDDDND
jgi:hypothetical protein